MEEDELQRPGTVLTLADVLAQRARLDRRMQRRRRLNSVRAEVRSSCSWGTVRLILIALQFVAQTIGGTIDYTLYPDSYTLPKCFLSVGFHGFLLTHHILVFMANGWYGFKKRANKTIELLSLMVQVYFFAIFLVIVLCGNENKFDMKPYYILRGLMLIIATLQVFILIATEYSYSTRNIRTIPRSMARQNLTLLDSNSDDDSPQEEAAAAVVSRPRDRDRSRDSGRSLSKMMENLIVAVDDKVEFPKPLVITPPKEKAAAAREPYFFRERLSPSDQTPEDIQRQRSTGAISKRGIYYTPPMTEDSVDSTVGEIREPRSSCADARSRRRLRSFERPEAAISAETQVQIDPHTLIRTYITTFLDTSERNDSFGEPVVESPLDSFEWEGQFEADCLGTPAIITTRKTMTVTQMFADKAPIVLSTAEDNSFITVS